jgi:ferrous iron transport protein A
MNVNLWKDHRHDQSDEGRLAMDKGCDLAGCNHHGPAETCALNRLGVGCRGWVVSVGGDADLRRRLLEMGFCNGAEVEVVRRAPLGDPIEFRLRGYCLSLRDEQAKFVEIAKK